MFSSTCITSEADSQIFLHSPSTWEVVRGVPRRYQEDREEAPAEMGEEESPEEPSHPAEVGNDNFFLQYKVRDRLLDGAVFDIVGIESFGKL